MSCLYAHRANNVDEVRQNIVKNGMNSVLKFPHAEKVLSVCKFLVIHPSAISVDGEPISAEGMLPLELWDVVTVEEYLHFRLYGLELISILVGMMIIIDYIVCIIPLHFISFLSGQLN